MKKRDNDIKVDKKEVAVNKTKILLKIFLMIFSNFLLLNITDEHFIINL